MNTSTLFRCAECKGELEEYLGHLFCQNPSCELFGIPSTEDDVEIKRKTRKYPDYSDFNTASQL